MPAVRIEMIAREQSGEPIQSQPMDPEVAPRLRAIPRIRSSAASRFEAITMPLRRSAIVRETFAARECAFGGAWGTDYFARSMLHPRGASSKWNVGVASQSSIARRRSASRWRAAFPHPHCIGRELR